MTTKRLIGVNRCVSVCIGGGLCVLAALREASLSRSGRRLWVSMERRAHRFPGTHRLGGRKAFSAVYDARVKEGRGPVMVFALPNELGHARLGISISRKVGTAVRRNRIKRLLREAFRVVQHELPGTYDLVVVVRPHAPLELGDYQGLLSGLAARLHGKWQKRLEQRRGVS